MLLSHETTIGLSKNYANIVGHMCYAAYKLWNVCNYERLHYKEMDLDEYPDWYYQKNGIEKQIDPLKIADPYVVKVAA